MSSSNTSNYNNYGGTPSVQSGGSNRNSTKRNSNMGIPRGMITPNGFMNDPTAAPIN